MVDRLGNERGSAVHTHGLAMGAFDKYPWFPCPQMGGTCGGVHHGLAIGALTSTHGFPHLRA